MNTKPLTKAQKQMLKESLVEGKLDEIAEIEEVGERDRVWMMQDGK